MKWQSEIAGYASYGPQRLKVSWPPDRNIWHLLQA